MALRPALVSVGKGVQMRIAWGQLLLLIVLLGLLGSSSGLPNIVGNVAHDAVDTGNPVKVGGIARTTNPTAVAALDRVDDYRDHFGRSVSYPIAPRGDIVTQYTEFSGTSETTVLTAGGAGVFHDITCIIVTNNDLADNQIDFRDATAGSIIMTLAFGGNDGMAQVYFPVPFPQTTSNNNWTAELRNSSEVAITIIAVPDA